jgi:hypothetical protein
MHCSGFAVLIAALVLLLAQPVGAQLQTYDSRHYRVHTNLPREQAAPLGAHMDLTFQGLARRFRGFEQRTPRVLDLYLFATQEDYIRFLGGHGINATGSGGMFFVQPTVQGLATWVEGQNPQQLISTLQHEGFHQFAWQYIGHGLPIWVNEGLAQYYEDAILQGRRLEVGMADAQRIGVVKRALERGTTLDLLELVAISGDQWGATLNADPGMSQILYAQSWSLVYYLVHGRNGRYQRAFEGYLHLLARGEDSVAAFRRAFGTTNLDPLERQWREFAAQQEPDPVTDAAADLMFLGEGLQHMTQDAGESAPDSFEGLQQLLQRRQFRMTSGGHGLRVEMSAGDDGRFTYTGRGGEQPYQMLPAEREGLLPRITAPMLDPTPTLTWQQEPDGDLVYRIEYR